MCDSSIAGIDTDGACRLRGDVVVCVSASMIALANSVCLSSMSAMKESASGWRIRRAAMDVAHEPSQA